MPMGKSGVHEGIQVAKGGQTKGNKGERENNKSLLSNEDNDSIMGTMAEASKAIKHLK